MIEHCARWDNSPFISRDSWKFFFSFFLISEKIGKKEKKCDGRAVVERILNLIVRDGIFWIPKNSFLFFFSYYRVEKIKVAKRS